MDTTAQTVLDPGAVNVAKAIRQSESGGNFQAKGKSGEFGAYQFTDGTWNAAAQKYLGQHIPLQQATPEQQNEVAYKQIKEWKDAGNNVGQIASMWNAGAGEPNAYLGSFSNGSPSHGVNKFGAHFDVPAYAKSVATTYQKLKGGQQPGADPNNPSSTASTENANVTPPSDNSVNTYGASFPAGQNEGLPTDIIKEVGNVPSSALNLGKGLFGMLMHPIKTVEGIGNTLVGAAERGYSAVTGNEQQNNQQTQTFDAVTNALKERYGSLDNAKRTMINDPIGVIADVAAVLSGTKALTGVDVGGAVNKVLAPLGDSTAGQIVGKGMDVVGNAAKAVATAPLKLAAGISGAETGVGYTPIAEGMKASMAGGDALKSYTEGLRGGFSPEELVQEGKDTLQQIVNGRSQSYQTMLEQLKTDPTTYDISPIRDELGTQLSRFKIQESPDGLDFTRSKFALDTTAQTDIQNLYNYVKGYGFKAGDRTALGVDNLKQILASYYSPNSDYRAFTEGLRSATRNVLEDAPGYTDEMKNYADMTESIDNTRKALSLGDKASVETSFKKLISALKNNDFRNQVLQELDQATGSNLVAKIAGQRMSSIVPRGLAPYIETVGGLSALSTVGIVPLLGIALTTSPRLVGEFLRYLGIGAAGTAKVLKILAPAALPTGGVINTLINPAVNAGQSQLNIQGGQ